MKVKRLSLVIAGVATIAGADANLESHQSLDLALREARTAVHTETSPTARDVLHQRIVTRGENSGQLQTRGSSTDFFGRAIKILNLPDNSSVEYVMAHVDANPDVLLNDRFKSWERSYLRNRQRVMDREKEKYQALKADEFDWLAHSLGMQLVRHTRKLQPRQAAREAKQRKTSENKQSRLPEAQLAAKKSRLLEAPLAAKKNKQIEAERLREAGIKSKLDTQYRAARDAMRQVTREASTSAALNKLPVSTADLLARWKGKKILDNASTPVTNAPAEEFCLASAWLGLTRQSLDSHDRATGQHKLSTARTRP